MGSTSERFPRSPWYQVPGVRGAGAADEVRGPRVVVGDAGLRGAGDIDANDGAPLNDALDVMAHNVMAHHSTVHRLMVRYI